MKLYYVRSENASWRVIAADAYRARQYAIESGIGGHKIDRHVFRTEDGKIVEVAEPPGVLSEEAAGINHIVASAKFRSTGSTGAKRNRRVSNGIFRK